MAFTASDCFRLKVLRILETAGERVLTYTLKCGTDGKSPAVPLDDYLKSLPPSSTSNFKKKIHELMKRSPKDVAQICQKYIEKQFTDTDMAQIKRDPACDSFDITLLHKVIKIACENVAEMSDPKWKDPASDEVESLVTKIKEARNNVVHEKLKIAEKDFLAKVVELRDTFTKALEATKVRYNRDDSELIRMKNEVMTLVDAIKRENLGNKEILENSASKLLPLFKVETDREVREKLKSAKNLDPLHFLSGHKDNQVDVENIFTKITIEERKDEKHSESKKNKCNYIDYLKLLIHTCGQPSPQGGARPKNRSVKPKMLLVEGDAGGGKTTLLTFVLAEWLKEKRDCRVEGLHDYDLLLWVVCREQSSSSLEDFVIKLLPEAHEKYNYLLLPLLKQCKGVLVLIDGLDEKNDVSRKLVTDILSHGKDCPNFTVLCTSRSESVLDTKANTPKEFHFSHVKLAGISPEERTEFVVKHYNWLTGGTQDTAGLRQVMHQIGWKELFRLPLNLVFLSFLYSHDPQSVTPTIKQSELYQIINKWSVEKLQDRLAAYRQTGARISRQRRIKRVLNVVREIALKGLLHGRIYLSEEDQDLLSLSCENEGLPEEEVMQAFYSLRREVAFGVVTECYCAPHKGLQEFFAAQHIVGRLQEYKQGDIMHMLQDWMPGREVRLVPLRNMFCHLLGLLNRQNDPMVTAMKETVDLIRESGVAATDDWLSVLADTEAHSEAMRRVAHHIKNQRHFEIISVEDGTMDIAKELLPLVPHRTIEITLAREIRDVHALIPALACHTVTDVWLEHHYKYPSSITSEHLLRQLPRDDMKLFMGHLDAGELPLLPTVLRELFLVVTGSDHARRLMPALTKACTSLPDLFALRLHVPVSTVSPEALTPLPAVSDLYLSLSGVSVTNLEAAWRIASACYPGDEGYDAITFREVSLGLDEWTLLFQALKDAEVKVRGGIEVPSDTLTEEEGNQLKDQSKAILGCRLVRIAERFLH